VDANYRTLKRFVASRSGRRGPRQCRTPARVPSRIRQAVARRPAASRRRAARLAHARRAGSALVASPV